MITKKNAQYGALQDDLLLDKNICSIKDHNLRERLWLDKEITLDPRKFQRNN